MRRRWRVWSGRVEARVMRLVRKAPAIDERCATKEKR